MDAKPNVYLGELGEDYADPIREGLDWIGLKSRLKPGDRVFVKPNLTFPVYQRGVMTNPECVEALVVALKDYTDRIVVGEADSGGYNRFSIDEVLDKTGMRALAKRYGVEVVNLSPLPHRPIDVPLGRGRRPLQVPMPTLLLDEIDLFVSVPVPKIHMYTQVSVSIKNQWGCIPEPAMRLRLHPLFQEVIAAVNAALRQPMAVVDGRWALDRSGPMRGDPVRTDWLMVADDLYAADWTACRLMGIDPASIRYLRYLARQGRAPEPAAIRFSRPWAPLVRTPPFHLRRDFADALGTLAFRSRALNYLAYYSPLADFLHRVLYLFRKPFYNYSDPDKTHPQ